MTIDLRNPAALGAMLNGDLTNALVASTPGGIEVQEAAGQQALVGSTDMPLELSPGREAFEALGFTFGDKIDEVFQQATLPAGWTRAATGHSMHSDILDQHGRRRVSVFYKAAFYDRRASADLMRRFKTLPVDGRYNTDKRGLTADQHCVVVLDQGQEIHRTEVQANGEDWAHWDAVKALEAEATAWLAARYPDWENPLAHWDEEGGAP